MKRLLVLLTLLGVACGSSQQQTGSQALPTMKFGEYSAETGPSPVGVIPIATLHDAQRNKDVTIAVDYPTRGGPFPIVIFSHAYGLEPQTYEPLASYWASNGYVVIRPTHADAGVLREAMRDRPRDVLQTPPPEDQRQRRSRSNQQQQQEQQPATPPPFRPNPLETIYDKEREPQWRDRVADIKLVLDSLRDLDTRFPELALKLDTNRIGVAGHSYGAFTALLTADPRIKALVLMSPPGPSATRGLTASSFANLRVPTLFMVGSAERGGVESEDVNWRKQAFESSPNGDKFFVLLEGGRSMSFTGGSAAAFDVTPREVSLPPNTQYPQQPQVVQPVQRMPGGATQAYLSDRAIFQRVKVISLAFLDAYLREQATARDLLTQNKMPSGVTISAK